jgi:hypothetical protein
MDIDENPDFDDESPIFWMIVSQVSSFIYAPVTPNDLQIMAGVEYQLRVI